MGVFVAIIILLPLLSWLIFSQFGARQHIDFAAPLSQSQAYEVAQGYFRLAWAPTSGQGDLNYRPRLRAYAPTLSIDIGGASDQTSEVSIYVSEWKSYFGLMVHATLMWRKKRGLAKRLASARLALQN